jgi:hypothetical protein
MSTPVAQKPLDYFRIAWQSALAASVCLGLPAGLLFWLIILQHLKPFQPVERFVTVLQNGGLSEIIGVLIGAFAWGIILSRISGYRTWWWLVAASMLGVYLGRRLFWIIYAWLNIDFSGLPVYVVLGIHISGLLLSVTFCTGLTHGLILRNWKATLTLASATSLVSVLAAFVAIVVLDQFGIRAGTGNAAMPKVTAVSLMTSAITGGMVLGVGFSWFSEWEKQQPLTQEFENT